MPQFEATVRIPLAPAETFALAHETGATRAAWDPSVVASRWLRGADGPSVGAILFTKSPRGRRRLLRVEHLTPDRLSSMRLVRGDRLLADYGEGMRVEPDAGGSRVTWKVTFKVRSPLAPRAIGQLVQPIFERELADRIAGLEIAASTRGAHAGGDDGDGGSGARGDGDGAQAAGR